MQKQWYDRIFYVQRDPRAANLMLLVLEIEEYFRRKGIIPCIGDFSTSGDKLDAFMERNKIILLRMFEDRFANPLGYYFYEIDKKSDLPFDFGDLG